MVNPAALFASASAALDAPELDAAEAEDEAEALAWGGAPAKPKGSADADVAADAAELEGAAVEHAPGVGTYKSNTSGSHCVSPVNGIAHAV
jgi:hypothetical protein